MHFTRSTIAALVAMSSSTLAQTFTDCNPTLKSCPDDTGLNAPTFSADFTKGQSASFSAAQGTTLSYGGDGAEFKISQYGQAPTLQSNFYFLFGRVDVVMKAAPGVGVISSIVLESDVLDEIDWEWLGGDTAQVQSNYFGKANTTTYDRARFHAVSTPQNTFHTYSIDWNADRCIYSIDGAAVRTLNYKDANGGSNYPQTPMKLKLGNWTPSKDATGTIEWAGGAVNWGAAPFSMFVKSVSIQNYNPADSYEYGDRSGSWQSIKIVNGTSSGGASGNNGGSSSSAPAPTTTASAVGTGKPVSGSITATQAPTSMLPVANITQTIAPSAANATKTGGQGAPTVAPSGFTSAAVPPSAVASGGSASSSTPASPPAANSAASIGIGAACSVLSLAAVFFAL